MLQCYSAEWNECRPSFPTHCYRELNMIAIMICLHRSGWQCQIQTLRTQFQTHCEAPFFALGLHAEGSPSGISFGRCDHSKDLVLMYANMQTFCVTLRDIWRRTMLMRRTIYWEPCLAPERCGSFKSTWTCPSGNLQLLEIEKTKTKSCPSENVQHRCIALSRKGEFLWNKLYISSESSGVRKQDGYRVIVGVSKNIVGR